MGQQGNSSKILKFKFMFFNDLKKAEYVLKFPWYVVLCSTDPVMARSKAVKKHCVLNLSTCLPFSSYLSPVHSHHLSSGPEAFQISSSFNYSSHSALKPTTITSLKKNKLFLHRVT